MTLRLAQDDRVDSRVSTVLAGLNEVEFDLPDEIVADCAVVGETHEADADGRIWLVATVEILTINAD